ncbi:PAS domain-containing sensor histidine kinase [Evansella clarkii]|uniref:PAS domain-containing sensor histidine kinase n=1 Tax=Evansella clarkii TaxID=79879 RepID=UPI00099894AC|nr:PAS domain-containing sensor histidine kinase [Evansella clarkii]
MDKLMTIDKLGSEMLFAMDLTNVVSVSDPAGKILYVNDRFCEISKYRRDEITGKRYSILNSGFHSRKFFSNLWKIVSYGKVWEGEIKNRAKDGTYYWVHTTIIPFEDENRGISKYIAIQKDITNKKETEGTLKLTLNKLANSNKELHAIKHALDESSIVAITDRKGTITYVNDTFCEISKYCREELIGQDHRILNSGHHSREFFKNLWSTIGKGEVWQGEIKNRAKDGSYYWVFTTIVPFLNEEGKPYQYAAIRNDITDQKKSEELLLRSEKLSIIGELAAGVAHEIRNPLTTLKGFMEFLNADEKEEKKKTYYNLLLEEIERINFIAGEFMLLAKPQAVDLSDRRLIDIVQKVIKFLESEIHLKDVVIKLDYDFKDEDVTVRCEENQLKQVFMNLIKNSIEAMPDGGVLHIKITVNSESAVLYFKDEGVGIPPEKIKRLGEPFYTTKEKGTGLGMMVCFKIIQNHHGNIQIESKENIGTTVKVTLPKKTV